VNGAQALIRTLIACGVDTCFSNPGTSEMHFVAALDHEPGMRGVLCLFEGVATGAADGYGRMAGRPAATLLHLGPGLANGLANLHNAHRAGTPLLNIVGDHATHHKRYDAPLESDIDSLARPVSSWIRRSARSADVGADAADAVAAARRAPGGVATLILPADVSWSAGGEPAAPPVIRRPAPVPDDVVRSAAKVLRSGEPCLLLLGGSALSRAGLDAASRIAAGTGARLLGETFPARLARGAGLPALDRLAYLAEFATAQLAGTRQLILAGTRAPVSFFAYPEQASSLVPGDGQVHQLAGPGDDVPAALAALAALAAPEARAVPQPAHRPALPGSAGGAAAKEALTAENAAAVIGALLPEGAIVSDEANTSGLWLPAATAGAPPHDWLTLTGGAIGQGLPVATGAAAACPDRPVLALEADGSAMYTISALWTHAREGLDVTTVIFSNPRLRHPQPGTAAGRRGRPRCGRRGRCRERGRGRGRCRERGRGRGRAGRPEPARSVPAGHRFHCPGRRYGCPGQPRVDHWGVRGAAAPGPGRAGPAPHRGHRPAGRLGPLLPVRRAGPSEMTLSSGR
jgi:acetolactate synthase-1/2/3 large subunit